MRIPPDKPITLHPKPQMPTRINPYCGYDARDTEKPSCPYCGIYHVPYYVLISDYEQMV